MDGQWIKTDDAKKIFNHFLSNAITVKEALDQLEKKSVNHCENKQLESDVEEDVVLH